MIRRRAFFICFSLVACAPDAIYVAASGTGAGSSSSTTAATSASGLTSSTSANATSTTGTVCPVTNTCGCLDRMLSDCPSVAFPFGMADCTMGACADAIAGAPPAQTLSTLTFATTTGACEGSYVHLDSGTNALKVDDTAGNLAFAASGFTLESWVRPTSKFATVGCVLGRGDNGGQAGTYYLAIAYGTGGAAQVELRRGGRITDSGFPITANGNTWSHIAGVYDNVANEVRVYVNGSRVKTESTLGDTYSPDMVTAAFIGACGIASGGRYDGELAYVGLYGHPTTDTAMMAHYNATGCP